jgi:hypothetical protein
MRRMTRRTVITKRKTTDRLTPRNCQRISQRRRNLCPAICLRSHHRLIHFGLGSAAAHCDGPPRPLIKRNQLQVNSPPQVKSLLQLKYPQSRWLFPQGHLPKCMGNGRPASTRNAGRAHANLAKRARRASTIDDTCWGVVWRRALSMVGAVWRRAALAHQRCLRQCGERQRRHGSANVVRGNRPRGQKVAPSQDFGENARIVSCVSEYSHSHYDFPIPD